MMSLASRKNRAFSLIELVIVVVIIGIIAAIAIPRMSRGAAGATDSALTSNLATVRKALELYAAEHNNTYPTAADVVDALTKCSDASGTIKSSGTVTQADATHPFGPYLRAVPTVNIGTRAGSSGMAAADAAGIGWLYTAATGSVVANAQPTGLTDAAGKLYTAY